MLGGALGLRRNSYCGFTEPSCAAKECTNLISCQPDTYVAMQSAGTRVGHSDLNSINVQAASEKSY